MCRSIGEYLIGCKVLVTIEKKNMLQNGGMPIN